MKNKLLLLLFKKNEYLFLFLRRERNRFVFGAFAVVSYEKGVYLPTEIFLNAYRYESLS